MSFVLEVIKARNARGWSQESLAKFAGVSSKTVSRLENGGTVESKSITLISHALQILPPTWGDVNMPKEIAPIPEWDAEIACGTWIDCSTAQLDTHKQADVIRRGMFIVRVSGDSMLKDYASGDRVLFRIVRFDEEALIPGADYYWQRFDGQCTLKRFVRKIDNRFVLAAINKKKYPKPLEVTWDDLARVAIVESIVKRPWG